MRKPHVGMHNGQSACNPDQTNTYVATLREHTSIMSDFLVIFYSPPTPNVRFLGHSRPPPP